MATKTKLTATLPDGGIATRTTARTYTHVIATRYTPERQAQEIAQAKERIATFEAEGVDARHIDYWKNHLECATKNAWHGVSWCGRPDLAVKAADQARKYGGAEVQIVPIND